MTRRRLPRPELSPELGPAEREAPIRTRRGFYSDYNLPIKWSKAQLDALGTMPDHDLAAIMKVSGQAVWQKREDLGIPPFGGTWDHTQWTAEMIEALGTMSDKALGRKYGVSYVVIAKKRKELGIETPFPVLPKFQWTPEKVALLGTMSDVDLAQKLGISNGQYVTKKRLRLKIAAYHPEGLPTRQRKLLGTASDTTLATKWGLTVDTVAYWRRKLGIPAWHAQFNIPKPKKKAEGEPRKTPIAKVQWTPEMIALLGTQTDSFVGRQLGIARELVRNERHKYGIAAWYSQKLTKPVSKKRQ